MQSLVEAGARTEIPGCSLCMGNQARVKDNAVVFSTSTRNFDNRMGKGAQVYLGSAELAAVAALLGKIPTKEEYLGRNWVQLTEKFHLDWIKEQGLKGYY